MTVCACKVKDAFFQSVMLLVSLSFAANAAEERVKRQATTEEPKKEESFEKELCKDKDAGEWFRLVAGEGDNCRDVIQCTSSVGFTLNAVECDLNSTSEQDQQFKSRTLAVLSLVIGKLLYGPTLFYFRTRHKELVNII